MISLTSSFEMMSAANGMCVEFGVVEFVGCRSSCGFSWGDCRFTGVVAGIGSTVPGILFLVCLMWVQGFVHSVHLFIGFVYVFTGVSFSTL